MESCHGDRVVQDRGPELSCASRSGRGETGRGHREQLGVERKDREVSYHGDLEKRTLQEGTSGQCSQIPLKDHIS